MNFYCGKFLATDYTDYTVFSDTDLSSVASAKEDLHGFLRLLLRTGNTAFARPFIFEKSHPFLTAKTGELSPVVVPDDNVRTTPQ